MNFNKSTEYALRILSYMSLNESDLYTADVLHENLQIPKKYLQRILTDLVRGNFIISIRGRNGGFSFARDINTIHLAEIINFSEGIAWEQKCFFGFKDCALDQPCIMHNLWAEKHDAQVRMLNSTTLGDLKSRHRKM